MADQGHKGSKVTIQWKEAVAGALSGAVTVLMLHPLDVAKTRLQVQESGYSRYRGAVHAVRTITRREGLHGLYAGAHVNLHMCVHFQSPAELFEPS